MLERYLQKNKAGELMEENFNKNKIIEYLFDPTVSAILSELETSSKDSTYLSKTLDISPDEIKNQLSYLIEHGFVSESQDTPVVYSVNGEKLAEVMEHDENYQSAVDGLTKLDGFLN